MQSIDPPGLAGGSYAYAGQLPGLPSTLLAFASEQMGNEFSVLSDFLDQYEARAPTYQNSPASTVSPIVLGEASSEGEQRFQAQMMSATSVAGDSPTEKFFITAVDQSNEGTYEERLTEVIQAKYEAGLLKPYHYAAGYCRLLTYADSRMSTSSRQRIQAVLAKIRPRFRKVAESLADIDLVLVEEAFERLLLSYDRVFSSIGVPSCLWRRTGEIYKANKEFAELIGIDINMLREGKLCIHELMAESSAVNYWEKYGLVAFDLGQKAVLTSCILVIQDPVLMSPHILTNATSHHGVSACPISGFPGQRRPACSTLGVSVSGSRCSGSDGITGGAGAVTGHSLLGAVDPSKHVSCCFSFTIRRDKFSIPSAIVGNFLPINCHT